MHRCFMLFLRLGLIVTVIGGAFFQPLSVQAASLPAEINKQFTPLQIDAGGVSVLRVTIFNPNAYQLANASWTDNLVSVQPGLYIATPAGIVNTCGGSVTAVPGTTNLALNNGTVPPQIGIVPGECYVEVNVSSVTPGNLINTIPPNNLVSQGDDAGTIVNITNTTPASATISVLAVTPPSLTKGFAPNTIFVGRTSLLTITINNNDTNTNLTGATYTDTLPNGVVVAGLRKPSDLKLWCRPINSKSRRRHNYPKQRDHHPKPGLYRAGKRNGCLWSVHKHDPCRARRSGFASNRSGSNQ